MATRILPPQTELRRRFDYDPETGILTHRHREPMTRHDGTFNAQFAGKRAGSVQGNRLVVSLSSMNCGPVLEHRVIYMWMTGHQPPEIDHRDGNPLNNRWDNLRAATRAQNSFNMRGRSKTGFKGVTHDPKRRGTKQFAAQITVDGKTIHLGRYKTAEEAHSVYCEAALKHFGSFAKYSLR